VSEFFQSIGLDAKLLLSQAVNFLILILLLRVFAYKPILRVLKERRQRIEEGIEKAEEADRRLADISILKKEKLQEAQQEGLVILRKTEDSAKKLEEKLLESAHKKEADILEKAKHLAGVREKEAQDEVMQKAANLVKEAIIKTTQLQPDAIDEKLIKTALSKAQQ